MGDILGQLDTPWRRGGRVVVMDSSSLQARKDSLLLETGRPEFSPRFIRLDHEIGSVHSYVDVDRVRVESPP